MLKLNGVLNVQRCKKTLKTHKLTCFTNILYGSFGASIQSELLLQNKLNKTNLTSITLTINYIPFGKGFSKVVH